MKLISRPLAAFAVVTILLCGSSFASAQTAPNLGDAAPFAVLAATTVTNTGSTVVTGNVGVSPGSAITGFPPGTVTAGGSLQAGNATAAAAQVSLTTAYNDLAGQTPTGNLTGIDLGTQILGPGVYKFDTSAQLTGALTLNGGGNTAAVFIFQIGSTLTTASNSSIVLVGGAQPCNVFFQVGSSATLGTGTTLIGNILALTSITLNTSARVAGRALARNGAVTLDTNTVSTSACTSAAVPPATPPAGCPLIGINPPVFPGGTVGVAYSQPVLANSGTAPYTYLVTEGTLPAGLSLSTGGTLAGTPTSPLAQTFVIRATDVLGCFAQRQYTFLFGVPVPTLPQIMIVFLAFGLAALGYRRLRVSTNS